MRVSRLSELRGELAISRKKRDEAVANLQLAGQNAHQYSDRQPDDHEWLSPADFRDRIKEVTDLEQEASQNIAELRDLGADAALFKLNGD